MADAIAHLPEALESRLLKPFAGSAGSRIGASAALKALKVLVRRHPEAALDMAGAAALQAGRAGVSEIRKALGKTPRTPGSDRPEEEEDAATK